MKAQKNLQTIFVIILLILISNFATQAQIELISGMKRGSYNRFATDIKRITQVPVEVFTSGGSLENFNQLIQSEKPLLAFLQYDVLIYKKYKDRENGTKYTDNLCVLLPLAGEEIHLICRRDDESIQHLADLKNKRVAIGSKNQGTYITASLIKGLRRVKWIDVPIGFDKAFTALMSGEVDAIFYVGYAPATKLYRFTQREKIKLVPIKYRKLKTVYSQAVIPAGTYKWADYDVETFAVKSVLVTNVGNEKPEQIKRNLQLLGDIKRNINLLRKDGHPKWNDVTFDYQEIKWRIYPGAVKAVFPY